MAVNGALIKMIILAYETAEKAENGGLLDAKDVFKVLINPESYTTDLKLSTSDTQAQGTSATQSKFGFIHPEELTFEFLFDMQFLDLERHDKSDSDGYCIVKYW